MRKEFEVNRTHKYGNESRNEVPVEFSLRGKNFDEVKERVKREFGVEDPDKAPYTGISVDENKATLQLQTNETCRITDGARISVLMKQEHDGTIKTHIAPNHHIWDSSRPGVENVSRGIRSALQDFLTKK